MKKQKKEKFVICVKNQNCDDLEPLKIYRVISDKMALKEGYLRIIDASGESYLYPASYFVPVSLPQKAQAALLAA